MNISDKLKGFAMKQVYAYLDKDPDTNIPKVLDYLQAHDKGGGISSQVDSVRQAISDPNNNWARLVKSLWTDIDAAQRRALVERALGHSDGPHVRLQPALHRLLGGGIRQQAEPVL